MINFVKYRHICLLGSLALFTVALGFYFYRVQTRGEAFKYSVDFTGGTQVLLKFDNQISSNAVREVLEGAGWAGATTREFGKNEVLVRVKDFSNNASGLAERMKTALEQSIPDNPAHILQNESVGAGIGESLRWNAFLAVLIAMIAILIYVAIRSWSIAFAVGAVVALMHDPLAILCVFLFLDREISVAVISAIIAVLGYSINDTIVIFSRIRDNMKKMRGQSLEVIVNESLNKTLRRTILTSISTALTVGSMFVLGGDALRDFSLALLVGIIFGTYSSIYIASPIMMMLYKDSH